jgi:hypothetical protein
MQNGQTTATPRQIGVIRSYDELIEAIRARILELNTTGESVDYVAGLPLRYCAKLLAPQRVRTIGSKSLAPLLGALGLALVVVEDEEQLARIRHRLEPRKKKAIEMRSAMRPDAKPTNGWGLWMNAMRCLALSDAQRSASARHAAKMRWRRKHAAKIAAAARWHKHRAVLRTGTI